MKLRLFMIGKLLTLIKKLLIYFVNYKFFIILGNITKVCRLTIARVEGAVEIKILYCL